MDRHYDFIIVGGGSAGCVLANRLSENANHQVLLIESGPADGGIYTKIPLGYGKTFYKSSINWMYETEPIPTLNQRKNYWPRGRVLGGSSAINAMVYIRGHQSDFDSWASDVDSSWSYQNVLPYFKKSEDNCYGVTEHHGGEGVMRVSDPSAEIHLLSKAFLGSCHALGYPLTPDFNGLQMEGCGPWQITTRNGLRESAATAFLKPALRRPNLTVLTNTQVKKILFKGRQAVGVRCINGAREFSIKCGKELILSAGAVNTPKLLELSGIGDRNILLPLGIEMVLDSPMVGKNMQDHLALSCFFKSTIPTLNQSLGSIAGQMKAAVQYAFTRKGLLSMSVNQVGAFVRSRDGLTSPNLQLYFNPISYDTAPAGNNRKVKPDRFPGFLISFNTCRPTSVGQVHIKDANYSTPPAINPNYISTTDDLRDVLDGYRIVRSIAGEQPLSNFVAEHHFPTERELSDDDLMRDFRSRASTVYHPCSTARMGKQVETSVLDGRLRVHGVGGLRVVDASAFPTITSGNINAPTIMLAEKAADMIKEDWIK